MELLTQEAQSPAKTWEIPKRIVHTGQHVRLEPLSIAHAADLWKLAHRPTKAWNYLRYGPFTSEDEFNALVERFSKLENQIFFAVIPTHKATASGWLSYCDVEPNFGALEIGSIWYADALQRTAATTEASFLLLRHAFDDLNYQRVAWRCNSGNEASAHAAERLGFVFEGVWRSAYISKGKRADWNWYSMLSEEWPGRKAAIGRWLARDNFDATGAEKQKLTRGNSMPQHRHE